MGVLLPVTMILSILVSIAGMQWRQQRPGLYRIAVEQHAQGLEACVKLLLVHDTDTQGTQVSPGLSLLHVYAISLEFALLVLQLGLQLRQVALDLVNVFLRMTTSLVMLTAATVLLNQPLWSEDPRALALHGSKEHLLKSV
jgi:hypothetical protein